MNEDVYYDTLEIICDKSDYESPFLNKDGYCHRKVN